MKVELHLPAASTLQYRVEDSVQELVVYLAEKAELTVEHKPSRALIGVRQRYILSAESRLLFVARYGYALDLELICTLQGAGADAEIKIGYKASQEASPTQEIKLVTLQEHLATNSSSRLLCKGLLDEKVRLAHAGTITVAPQAGGTSACLESRHLLKTESARAYVQPNLSVLTDAVECAHASAVGMFDEEMLFYMQARGLALTSAQVLLEDAFLAPVQ